MRILVLSDVHANLPALEAVLDAAPDYDAIWNLGDTVGYGASPNECMDMLGDIDVDPALVGNHDLAAVGLLPIKWFNAFAATAAGWTSAQLTEENIFRIRSSFTSASVGQFFLVHGSPSDPARDYVQNVEDAENSLGAVAAQYVLCGHTHVPMLVVQGPGDTIEAIEVQELVINDIGGRRALLNPGSVGQPRDGDPRASVTLLDTDALTATWIRVYYDIERAKNAITKAGLPSELASRLARGR